MLRLQKILCWFGMHDPMVQDAGDKYVIVCRCCERIVG